LYHACWLVRAERLYLLNEGQCTSRQQITNRAGCECSRYAECKPARWVSWCRRVHAQPLLPRVCIHLKLCAMGPGISTSAVHCPRHVADLHSCSSCAGCVCAWVKGMRMCCVQVAALTTSPSLGTCQQGQVLVSPACFNSRTVCRCQTVEVPHAL
jgi:hypothetical protein